MAKKNRPMKLLRVIEGLTFEQIKAKLEGPPYRCKVKDNDTYYIINYDQINSDFSNEVVRQCRGIILRKDTNRVVCYPFTKFFNHGEKYASRIDWESARIQEKIDGSIIKLWFDEVWHVSTNGTIDAQEAELPSDLPGAPKNFYELFETAFLKDTKWASKEWSLYYTYMFELVSPWNKVVVPHTETKIYHIGTRDNITGEELDIDLGIQKPRQFNLSSLEDVVKMAESLPFNEEGYVVVDKNWNRIKVKSPAYVAAHHLKNNGVLTTKRFIDLIRTGEEEEFLTYYPEFKEQLIEIKRAMKSFYSTLKEEGHEAANKAIIHLYENDRKGFAEWAVKQTLPALMFAIYDGKIKDVKDYYENIPSEKLAKMLDLSESDN